MMLFEYGSSKEARCVPSGNYGEHALTNYRFLQGALHMGYPMANSHVYPWMERVMAS
jgi:hypothetical protein